MNVSRSLPDGICVREPTQNIIRITRPAAPFNGWPTVAPRQRSHGRRGGQVLQVQTPTLPAASAPTGPAIELNPDEFSTIPAMWSVLARRHGDRVAVSDPHQVPQIELTYRELEEQICSFAAGLSALGLRKGDIVSLFSENSSRWLVADQACMLNGAADAVRGSTTPVQEQAYILRHSHSVGLIAQDAAALEKLVAHLTSDQASGLDLRFAVVLWGEAIAASSPSLPFPVASFAEVLRIGTASKNVWHPAIVRPSDLASLVYTSGTTGQPKAVMLSQGNILYQLREFEYFVAPEEGDQTLSLLPPWHIYERAVGYYIFSCGCKQVYSNVKRFRDDLTACPPDFMVAVPLVLDTLYSRVLTTLRRGPATKKLIALTLLRASAAFVRARRVLQGVALQYAVSGRPIVAHLRALLMALLLWPVHRLATALVYSKIRAALGVRKGIISGGGSLAAHLDDFYESIGLPVINGWGLTETSPVLACRRNTAQQNVRGTVGMPIPGTSLRIVDPVTLEDVQDGCRGLVLAKGPGVMQGYYENEPATAAAFRAGDGWFDTGDLGWRAPRAVAGSHMAGNLVLCGRSKETIVLSSGENVEPQPIEDDICVSPYIKFATVVGQDCKHLGALIVIDDDALAEHASSKGLQELSEQQTVALIRAEVTAATAKRTSREHIRQLTILPQPYTVEDGMLTRTMKPRRPAIYERYANQIADLQRRLT